ncbi:20752_t:CDS:2 [Entrophospora sp. SA101]|nr:20752_t:CDS:2 [Entrophospora sp. SA101]
MVLSDDSTLEPCEKMKCNISASVNNKCEDFMNKSVITDELRNITHNSPWVESKDELGKRVERILDIIGEVWNNWAFGTSMSCNEQSEGTYITDVIVPLLWGLPNDGLEANWDKPDVMALVGHV